MSAEDYPISMTTDELHTEAEWWHNVIIDADGSVSLSHVLQELHDYRRLMTHAEEVYFEITCGKMSKFFYSAEAVLTQYRQCSEDAILEIIAETLDRIDAGETTKDLREDFEL